MLVKPSLLAFITTYQCTAACDDCCYSCSPTRTDSIPFKRMIELIEDAGRIPTIRTIGFTGGECFLLGKKLDELIAAASGGGYDTRCISNGYWAETIDDARARVGRLVDAGLYEINFSTGAFHSRYVPVERVINAICASVDAGIKVKVNIETFSESAFDTERFLLDRRIAPLISSKALEARMNLWMQGGGPVTISQPSKYSGYSGKDTGGCRYCLDYIGITPELDAMACCGLSLTDIPEMRIGSVADAHLYDVLEAAEDDLLKMWIRTEGPENILKFVKQHEPGYELPVNAAHPCESCKHLYHDPVAQAVIKKHYSGVKESIVHKYFTHLALAKLYGQKELPMI